MTIFSLHKLAMVAILLGATAVGAAQDAKILHFFSGEGDGASPFGHLILDPAGNLYGTASSGGTYGQGVIFEFSPGADGTWTGKILHEFTGREDGGQPVGGVVFDGAGNLFGTASLGGTHGGGLVFELTPAGGQWTETVLYNFYEYFDGYEPESSLTFDKAGNLYGTTTLGPQDGHGAVFELSPSTGGLWTEKPLHTFTGGRDGAYPIGGLIFDAAGNLYGAANEGGVSCPNSYDGCGVVFQLVPGSDGNWSEKVLHSFTGGADGSYPAYGTLAFDSAGNLFGTAGGGGDLSCALGYGYGCGVVFELIQGPRGIEERAFAFHGNDGYVPAGGVTFDSAGNAYGTAEGGGSGSCTSGCGVVFQLRPSGSGWDEQWFSSMALVDGWVPLAGVVLDASGNLYGTAIKGGVGDCSDGCGVLFKLALK